MQELSKKYLEKPHLSETIFTTLAIRNYQPENPNFRNQVELSLFEVAK